MGIPSVRGKPITCLSRFVAILFLVFYKTQDYEDCKGAIRQAIGFLLFCCSFTVLLLLFCYCFAVLLLFFCYCFTVLLFWVRYNLKICRTPNSISTVRNKTTKSQAPPHCAFTIPSAYRLKPTTARDCNEARAEGLGSSLQYFRQETFQPFIFRISEELIWSVLFLDISTVHK